MPMPKRKPNYDGKKTMEELMSAVCEYYYVSQIDFPDNYYIVQHDDLGTQ